MFKGWKSERFGEVENIGLLACFLVTALFFSCSTTNPKTLGGKLTCADGDLLCSDKDGKDRDDFQLTAIVPSAGDSGETVSIRGNQLSGQSVRVFFNDEVARVQNVLEDEIIVTVPGQRSEFFKNPADVRVERGTEVSQLTGGFRYEQNDPCTDGPIITDLLPSEVSEGTQLTIQGAGFNRDVEVSLDVTPAVVVARSLSSVTVTVPSFESGECLNRDGCLLDVTLVNAGSGCTAYRPDRVRYLINDIDHDGLPEDYEINVCGSNPEDPNSDDDGLDDWQECVQFSDCNPMQPDTDGDGIGDALEVTHEDRSCQVFDFDRDGVEDTVDCDNIDGSRNQNNIDAPDGVDTNCKIDQPTCAPYAHHGSFPWCDGYSTALPISTNSVCMDAEIIPGKGVDEWEGAQVRIALYKLVWYRSNIRGFHSHDVPGDPSSTPTHAECVPLAQVPGPNDNSIEEFHVAEVHDLNLGEDVVVCEYEEFGSPNYIKVEALSDYQYEAKMRFHTYWMQWDLDGGWLWMDIDPDFRPVLDSQNFNSCIFGD